MLKEGNEENSKGGGIGRKRTGSKTTKQVNCEENSDVRDGAGESEGAGRYTPQTKRKKKKKKNKEEQTIKSKMEVIGE